MLRADFDKPSSSFANARQDNIHELQAQLTITKNLARADINASTTGLSYTELENQPFDRLTMPTGSCHQSDSVMSGAHHLRPPDGFHLSGISVNSLFGQMFIKYASV